MAGSIQRVHRNHRSISRSLDKYIYDNNPIRFIDAFVDSLDPQAQACEHAVPRESGRPPHHPGGLLKLYIWGYLNQIRPSLRPEKEARRNVQSMSLLGKLAPDFKAGADSRRHSGRTIPQVCC